MKKRLWIVWMLLWIIILPGRGRVVQAQTGMDRFYVAVDGSDANPGTFDEPWQTIQQAVDVLFPGDTVYIREGVYAERVFLSGSTGVEGQSGTASGGVITYAAFPGEQVILDGSGFSWGSAFLSGKDAGSNADTNPAMSYITISGFEIYGYPEFGIAFENDSHIPEGSHGSHHIVIEDCIVHDNGNVGILIEGGDRSTGGAAYEITIRNCETYNNANHGIKLTGDEPGILERELITNAVIEGCSSFDNALIGIHVSTGHDHISVLNNAAFNNGHQGLTAHEIRDAAYSGNLVYGNGFSSSEEGEGIMIWRSENVLVSANTVHNNHGFGIRIWEGLVDGGSAPVVENNLLYQNQGGGLKISGTVEDGRVYNNTIVFNTNTGLQLGDMISGFEILNTILAGNQPQLEYDGGAWFDYNLYNPDVLFPDKGEHSITGDPLFISVEEQDFHLQPDSPAVDSGNLLLSVSSDIEGTARPLGAGYDIGAYESTAAGAIFQDVPPGCYGYDEIEALYRAGYIAGCSAEPRLFCPDNTMTRAESAVFVERGLHGAAFDPPDPEVVVFADVALEAWYADWVDGLWLDDFTAGCSTDPLLYCPLAEHTRAEGSVFFLRLLMGKDYKPALVEGLFADVPLEEWYAPWMEEAYRQGLLDPCLEEPEMRICPEEPLSRAEAAVIMARAQGLVGQ